MKRQQKKTIFSIALSSCILLYFVFFYLWDNYLGVIPVPTNQKIDIRGQLMVRAKWAERMVKGSPVRIVRTISVCKKFPDSYKDQFFTIIGSNDQCERVQETPEEHAGSTHGDALIRFAMISNGPNSKSARRGDTCGGLGMI